MRTEGRPEKVWHRVTERSIKKCVSSKSVCMRGAAAIDLINIVWIFLTQEILCHLTRHTKELDEPPSLVAGGRAGQLVKVGIAKLDNIA